MRKSYKQLILLCILAVLIATVIVIFRFRTRLFPANLPPTITYNSSPAPQTNVPPQKQNQPLPVEINLQIPFTSQAPHRNWDLPYKEFCEETSVLMTASYISGQSISGPDDADAKLLAIKNFEEKRFGFYEDTNAEDTATILREHFNIAKVEIISNPTAIDIKTALANGKAVIAPLAGRELKNPYYQQPGPLYHMLVIKGYRKNGDFITNDPGTRRGADFLYKEKVIMDALSDWTGSDIDPTRKFVLVVG